MLFKLPVRTRKRLESMGQCTQRAAFIRSVERPIINISLANCEMWPQPLSFNYLVVLERLRPVTKPCCTHPADKQIIREGQTVCTECGLVYGNVYEIPLYVTANSGLTVHRRHFYRPEAYLKTHLRALGKRLPNWAANKLHHVWPYIYKVFRRVISEDKPRGTKKKRKNMLCYSYCIQQLLCRWDCDTEGLTFKPLKTVSRRREANRIWTLMVARFPDSL